VVGELVSGIMIKKHAIPPMHSPMIQAHFFVTGGFKVVLDGRYGIGVCFTIKRVGTIERKQI